jgi:cytochrome c oxidase cbb3-type subunit 3
MTRRHRATIALMVAGFLVACERESRPYRDLPVLAARSQVETQTPLSPGEPPQITGTLSPYQQNAWGVAEGKRLFSDYNCSGCHANGGGGMGPPLIDDQWIYGFAPANIYSTIVEGRPNGMPSFRNKIPDYQVWQLVAFVQAMSGQVPIGVVPSRNEHMQTLTAEPIRPYQGRVQTGGP